MHPPFRHLSALGVLCAALLSACTPAPQSGCPDDLEFFRTRLWEPTLSVQCIACHNAEGLAAGTRLVLQPPEEPGALEANFWAVRELARVRHEGTSLLLLKPSGLHPDGHGGGGLLAQDSLRYEDFRHFVDRVTGVPGACEASPQQACAPEANEPGARRRLRLLTRFEYDNTLRELLRLDGAWAGAFPAEEVVHGFDNNADARTVGQLLSDELLATAERAAEAAVANLGSHVSCAPGEACAREFITRFGERAFRRPLSDTEHARYLGLYNAVALEDGYTAGLQAVIATLLQSPHFLYRSELGEHAGDGRYVLTDYEVATELSYLFWGSMPDDELFAQARAGALRTPEQLATQARRLLASPRSRPMLEHFVSQWLELERLDQAQKDATAFADFTPSIRAAMRAETTTLFDHIIRQGSGRLPEFFSASYTFLSDELAAFYRLSGPVSGTAVNGLQRMELEGSGRGGFLTHGSILASQATPQTSSPVRRGKLVRERLLCQPLPPPPPGLNVELPPVDASLPNRERFLEHSRNPACASCHQLMDPIGFGFEHFDSVGRYQPTQNGQPVDVSGEVRASPHTEGPFSGVDGLQRKLAESPDVHACFSLQWLRFASGTSVEASSCSSRHLTERFQQGGLSIPELLVSLTQLPRFTVRTGESDGTPGQPPPPPGGDTPGGEPQPSGNVQVAVSVQGDWEAGYCHDVKVTNTGTSQLAWRVSLGVEGTLTHVWNAVATPEAGRMTFTGADWNHLLEPGASTSFGYCANR